MMSTQRAVSVLAVSLFSTTAFAATFVPSKEEEPHAASTVEEAQASLSSSPARKNIVRRVMTSRSVNAMALVDNGQQQESKKQGEVVVSGDGEVLEAAENSEAEAEAEQGSESRSESESASESEAEAEAEAQVESESGVASESVSATEAQAAVEATSESAVEAESATEIRSEYNIERNGMRFRTVKVAKDKRSGVGLTCEEEYRSGYSRPGTPRVSQASVRMEAFRENGGILHATKVEEEANATQFGDRLVLAAEASEAMKGCSSFFSFGDYTWCNKAMPKESTYSRKNVWGGKWCNTTVATDSLLQEAEANRKINNGEYEGLSFGIEELDTWSELMSNMYYLKTRIYDCYSGPPNGPLWNDWHGNHSRDNECKTTRCYTVEYEINTECIADKNMRECKPTCRTYKTLTDYLNGAGKLSKFVKMDVEGSEWRVLRDLLANEAEMAKIRTLDMEVHLTNLPNEMPVWERVDIMEELAKKFVVTGSTIQLQAEAESEDSQKELKKNPDWKKVWEMPHTTSGVPLSQYCISFMNRALL